jgi:hypothetical protein
MANIRYDDWPRPVHVWTITECTGSHYLPSLPLPVVFTNTASGVQISLPSAPDWHNRTANGKTTDSVAGAFIPFHEFDITSTGRLLECKVRDLRLDPKPGPGKQDPSRGGEGAVVGTWTAEDGIRPAKPSGQPPG